MHNISLKKPKGRRDALCGFDFIVGAFFAGFHKMWGVFMKTKRVLLVFLTFILLLTSACGGASKPIKAGTLRNSKLGTDIALGMKKDEVDKSLGTPSMIGTYYFYSKTGLTVFYKNGSAVMLATSSPDWETMDGFRVTSASDDVSKLYGYASSGEDFALMFDKDSKPTADTKSAAVAVILKISEGKISNINLSSKM